jgi:hypothetical protein
MRFCGDGTATAIGVFANDSVFDGGAAWDGEARLTLDGQVWTSGAQRHPINTRLRARLSNRPPPHVLEADRTLLVDAGLLPPFNLPLGVPQATIDEAAKLMTSPTWGAPYAADGYVQYWGTTGARGDIGPVMAPHAVWVLSRGSKPLHDLAAGLLDTAHTIPVHAWDRSAGTPIMRQGAREMAWMDGRGAWQPPLEGAATNHGWSVELAHAPSLGWVSYVLTGERTALDVVQSEAAWAIVAAWPFHCPSPGVYQPVPFSVWNGEQVRAFAWALRNVRRGYRASPPGAFRDYLGSVMRGTFAMLQGKLPVWKAQWGAYAGWIAGDYGTPGAMAPWQQDYALGELVGAYLDGWEEAAPVLTFLADGWLGRRCLDQGGWNPKDGASYNVPWQDSVSGQSITTWEAAAADIVRRGWSTGSAWPGGNFSLLAAYGLTHLAIVFPGRADLSQQLAALKGAPGVDANMPAHDPQFSVAPR